MISNVKSKTLLEATCWATACSGESFLGPSSNLGCGFVPWIKVLLQALLQYKAKKYKTTNI